MNNKSKQSDSESREEHDQESKNATFEAKRHINSVIRVVITEIDFLSVM